MLAGTTTTSDFPTTPGAIQRSMIGNCPYPPNFIAPGRPSMTAAFVARVSRPGDLVSSTILGGQCFDYGTAVALTQDGDTIVMGSAGRRHSQ